MTTLEKIVQLARHYSQEILNQDCQDLENIMTDVEIQAAIKLARDLNNLDSEG